MQHIWRKGEVLTGFWWENYEGRDHFKYPGVNGRIILKWILKKYNGVL